jgi:hypothetical protein
VGGFSGKGSCCNPSAAPLAANWDLGLERGSIPGLGGRLGTPARGGCSWAAKVAGEGDMAPIGHTVLVTFLHGI